MKQSIFLLLVVTFLIGPLQSQNTSSARGKHLSAKQAQEDFEVLYSSLINYHPAPYFYTSKEELLTFYEKRKAVISDSTTEMQLFFLCKELISKLRCGHTSALPSDAWFTSVKGLNNQIPFEVKFNGGKVYIASATEDKFDFSINDEVISINTISSQRLVADMVAIETGDGFTDIFRTALVEKRFRYYLLFLFGIPNEYTIEYRNKLGEIKQCTLPPSNKKIVPVAPSPLPPNFKLVIENKWSRFAFDSVANLGYLKITSFLKKKEYKTYYKVVFDFLKLKPNSKLILDLRENPGGDFRHGNRFLGYLTNENAHLNFERPRVRRTKNQYVKFYFWDKVVRIAFAIKPRRYKSEGQITETFVYKPKKNAFRGKIAVITNGITFSQAALVSSHLRSQGALFFGEETGGAELGCNGILNYKLVLPHSGIAVTMPAYHVKSNSTTGKFGYGVQPDFPIAPALDYTTDHALLEVMQEVKQW